MPLSSPLQFLGVWSGPMALAGSRPVYVCLQTIYGLNSGVFLSTPCICVILTGAWFGALSRVCLHAYYPAYCLFFCSPGYVHLYAKCYQPSSRMWTVFPPEGMRIGIRERPESPFTCSYIRSSLDLYLSTDSSV